MEFMTCIPDSSTKTDRIDLRQDARDKVVRVDSKLSTNCWAFCLTRTTLRITEVSGTLFTEVIDVHQSIARKVMDSIRQRIRSLVHSANAGRAPKNQESLIVVICEALDFLLDFERDQEKAQAAIDESTNKWRADDVFDYKLYMDNSFGLDLSLIADTAYRFLGKSPEQLCENIPSQFRIIHVESVLRHDLASRFEAYCGKLASALEDEVTGTLRRCLPPHSKPAENKVLATLSREAVIEDMLLPRVTYHGTPLWNVSSIVRHGFKMPGQKLQDGKLVASPRSNIAYNRGIYSSQAPFYALSYAMPGMQRTPIGDLPTLRLFICATVMGRTLSNRPPKDRLEQIHGPLVPGYDAHFDGYFEYIIHNPAAILPCYVIHLDLGSESAKQAILLAQKNPFAYQQAQTKQKRTHPKLNKKDAAPGDVKREAEAKKAAALKWFPNGFGTTKGTNFVIEEIGEVDDDEEEYGDWQTERHGFFREDIGGGSWMDAENEIDAGGSLFYGDEHLDEAGDKVVATHGSALDQYQSARRATRGKTK